MVFRVQVSGFMQVIQQKPAKTALIGCIFQIADNQQFMLPITGIMRKYL
jgi:hypothetical protein